MAPRNLVQLQLLSSVYFTSNMVAGGQNREFRGKKTCCGKPSDSRNLVNPLEKQTFFFLFNWIYFLPLYDQHLAIVDMDASRP